MQLGGVKKTDVGTVPYYVVPRTWRIEGQKGYIVDTDISLQEVFQEWNAPCQNLITYR
jgi:hypothetical protein